MVIAIINCDLDESEVTNCGILTKKLLDEETELIDIIKGDRISDISKYEGYIVSGSHASFNDDTEWMKVLREYFKEIHDKKIPCLCVCMSMQVIADMFGGISKKSNANEIGFTQVEILEESEISNGLERIFMVFQYHNDIVEKVPKGGVLTMKNDVCIQGFNYKNFYCVQFHPEITPKICDYISKREDKDPKERLNGVSLDYEEPTLIYKNFEKIVKNRN